MVKAAENLLQLVLTFWNNCSKLVLEFLGQSPETFKGGNAWQLVSGLHSVMVSVGIGFLVLFFLMGFCSQITNIKEDLKIESVIKMFLKLVLAQGILVYSLEIIQAIFRSAGALVSLVVTKASISFTELKLSESMVSTISQLNWLEGLLVLIVVLLFFILIAVLVGILLFTVYKRFFKMYTAAILAPLALSTLAGYGVDSTAKQFIRNLFAICLEAVVIVLAFAIFNALITSDQSLFGQAVESPLATVCIYLAEMALGMVMVVAGVKTADSTVKSVFGL